MMKNIFLFVLLTISLKASFCAPEYNCTATLGKSTPALTDLNCTLPNMPNMPIKAENVFDTNGNLKTYWNNQSICTVLEWMNEATPKLSEVDGIATSFTAPLTIKLISQPKERALAGDYQAGTIKFDSDSFLGGKGGNDFAYAMKHIVVHEFFHHAEKNSVKNIPSPNLWIKEGMAKMFEDIVYDGENPYLVYGNRGLFKNNLAEDILTNITEYSDRYRTFMFWNLMQEKCKPYFSVLIGSNTPLSNLNSATQNCTEVSNLSNDKLAGAFVLYNHAMIFHNNLRLIAGGEPSSITNLNKIVKKINSPKFQGTLNMLPEVGSSIREHSAKSFLITREKLKSGGDINLTFNASGDLKLVAVRVKKDGSSNVNDNFVMKSNDMAYELSNVDMNRSLFVTLVNTTDKTIDILDLNLKIRFERNATKNIVTDHERGLMWQDETDTWLDSWYGAKRHCTALTLGDYNDWRVPSYDELIHILDLDGKDTYRYDIFEHLGPVGYWSLELNGGVFPNTQSAKVVSFRWATWIWINTSQRMNTRCVRTK
jgi:hypothetical protein